MKIVGFDNLALLKMSMVYVWGYPECVPFLIFTFFIARVRPQSYRQIKLNRLSASSVHI
jgi:hypothetical protein